MLDLGRRQFITLLGGATAWPVVASAQQPGKLPTIGFLGAAPSIESQRGRKSVAPGGNVTGLANQMSDTSGKKLEFLREVVPGLRRLAIMANAGNPGSMLDMSEAQATARRLGLEVTTAEIRRAEDIVPAFGALRDRADALYLCPDALLNTNRVRINILAMGARLPTMHGHREYVEAGGLMSYGQSNQD